MAVFPTAADMGRPVPRPDTSLATYRPPTAATEGAEAQFQAGRQMQEFGSFLDKETASLEETAAQDALNKLRLKRAEMTYDPEKGFRRIQGGDVLKPGPDGKPLLNSAPDGFQSQIDDLGKGLITPRARALYNAAAAREMVAFKGDLLQHMMGQSEKYQSAVDKDTQTQILATAAQHPDDPAAIATLADRAAAAADGSARRTGLPSQGLQARSNVLRVAVESMLPTNPRRALAYFDSIKSQLDGPDIVALSTKLTATGSEMRAEDAANLARVGVGLPPMETTGGSGSAREQTGQDESGGNYGAVNKVSGAFGKYQFMPATWSTVSKAHPELSLPADMRQATPGQQDAAKDALDRDNAQALQAKGFSPTAANLYLAHRFGAEGAATFLNAKPDAKLSDVFQASWIQQNPDLKGVTVGQFAQNVQSRYGDKVPFDGSTKPAIFKGDTVGAYQQASLAIASRTDLTPTEKAKALALITQSRTQAEGLRTATVKSLDDYSQTILTTAMLDPSKYKDGSLSDIAQRYEAAGEGAKATRFRVLAAMEGPLKTFSTTASEGQRSLLTNVLEGLPKQIAEGLKSGDAEGKAQAKLRAGNLLSQAKESFGKGVNPDGLIASLKEAATLYAAVGDEERVREVQQFAENAYKAHAANQQPSTAAQQTLSDLKGLVDTAGTNSAALQLHSMMQETYDRQQADLKKDSLAAGARIYKDVGPLAPLDWSNPESIWQSIDIRSNQARKVKELSGNETAPFTGEDFERLRTTLDSGPPDQKKMLLRNLGRFVPDDLKTVTAIKLAGKDDETGQMYASAMARYGEGSPEGDAVADKILMGAQIIKNGGEAGRKPASTSDAWQTALQDKLGNALALHFGDKVPAEIASAIKAHYVASMWTAGKQGEKGPDIDALKKSIDAVTGGIINYRGQAIFAPFQGATVYNVEAALRTLTSADIPTNLKTQEGDQITAETIQRNGRLMSAGSGIYAVRIPDPRAGGDLKPILDPNTGKAFVIDLRPLLERAKTAQGNYGIAGPDVRPVPVTPLVGPSDYGKRR